MTCWHKCQVCSLEILRKHRITKKEKGARKNDRERKEWEERRERKMYLQRCFMCIYIFAIVKWNKWRKNLKKSAWMMYVSCIYSKMSVSWIVKVISSVSLFPIPFAIQLFRLSSIIHKVSFQLPFKEQRSDVWKIEIHIRISVQQPFPTQDNAIFVFK